jgi:ApaG protein
LLARAGRFVQRLAARYKSAMFEQQTAGVLVRVEPRYLPNESAPDDGRYFWAYTIEIVNLSPHTVQLISRAWNITDENGLTQRVQGAGVVGQQPVLRPGESFTYTSGAPLAAPSGVMVGTYSMVRVGSGEMFDIAVPAFPLDSPHINRRVN